jgi:hypothetical protein
MPPRAKKAAPANKVDETVENQENPVSSEEQRESTEKVAEPKVAKMAAANDVDVPVENQENPVISEEARESTDEPADDKEATKAWDKLAEANPVDETVENQENPGAGTFVDRHPEPVIFEDSAGIKYDVSKPFPELVTEEDSPEEKQRKARVRQTEAVLDAKKIGDTDNDHDHIEIEFLETGLTVQRRVWKKGQVLIMEDNEQNRLSNSDSQGNVWYEQSAEEQKERYGKVFFEKR